MEQSKFEQVKHIINFGGKPDIDEPLTAEQINELVPYLKDNPVYLAELKSGVKLADTPPEVKEPELLKEPESEQKDIVA